MQSGASAEALSHEDYLNAPGEKVSSKFSTPGKYSYCESHLRSHPDVPADTRSPSHVVCCVLFWSWLYLGKQV